MVICIIMGFTANVTYYSDSHEIDFEFGKKINMLLNVICLIQFLFTLSYVGLWIVNRSKLAVCKYEEERRKELAKNKGKEEPGGYFTDTLRQGRDFLFSSSYIKAFFCLIQYESDFLGLLIFFLSSFLGTFYRIEFFSLHMFFLVTQIDLLTNVFQAVTINIKLLALVSLLGLSFIVIFSIFSFNSYV